MKNQVSPQGEFSRRDARFFHQLSFRRLLYGLSTLHLASETCAPREVL